MKKNNDFIAQGINPKIAYRELTLNLKSQGYIGASIISNQLQKVTDFLVDINIL
jgi:hypothetical protein